MFTGGVTEVSVSVIGHLHKLTCLVAAGVAVFRCWCNVMWLF